MTRKNNSFIVLILCILLAGCSTWTPINIQEAITVLEQGDEIRVTSKDGDRYEFEVTGLTESGEIQGSDFAISTQDLAFIERRDIDGANTGLAVGGGVLLALILIATAAVASVAIFGF